MLTKAESIMWDNDPFAVPKTDESKNRVMGMVYLRMKSRGVDPKSQEAMRFSEGMPVSYANWLKAQRG